MKRLKLMLLVSGFLAVLSTFYFFYQLNTEGHQINIKELMEGLLYRVVKDGQVMLKFRILNVNLWSDQLILGIGSLLQKRKSLLHLDLSGHAFNPRT